MTGRGSRTVLVTGGASGVGRSIAAAFIDEGASVYVLDVNAEHIASFQAEFPDATALRCDVGDAGDVAAAFGTLTRLDVLVNNAGIAGPAGKVETLDVDEWDHCIDVNLNGAFYVTRLAAPLLKQSDGGAVVNIVSNAGLLGCPDRSPYAASKWALVGLTKTWAMELGPDNIRVNAVCPGCVSGPRIEAVIEKDALQRKVPIDIVRDVYLRQSSMRTFVSADEIAQTVLFLTSDAAAKVSGQAIAIDGHTETLSNWLD